jgi:hypothetical protein
LYQLHVDHAVGSITVADWYHVEGEKITSICTILDTSPFTRPSRDTAVDPVCEMTVDKGSSPHACAPKPRTTSATWDVLKASTPDLTGTLDRRRIPNRQIRHVGNQQCDDGRAETATGSAQASTR